MEALPVEHIEGRSNGELERRLRELVDGLPPAAHPLERFVVKASGRVFFVRASEIEWIEAAGNYVKLHVGAELHLIGRGYGTASDPTGPTGANDDRSAGISQPASAPPA